MSAGATPASKMPNLADRDYFQFHMRERTGACTSAGPSGDG